MVGLPGGVASPLYRILADANVNGMVLREGRGNEYGADGAAREDDVFNTVWVVDSDALPFYRAERYHQFHDGLGKKFSVRGFVGAGRGIRAACTALHALQARVAVRCACWLGVAVAGPTADASAMRWAAMVAPSKDCSMHACVAGLRSPHSPPPLLHSFLQHPPPHTHTQTHTHTVPACLPARLSCRTITRWACGSRRRRRASSHPPDAQSCPSEPTGHTEGAPRAPQAALRPGLPQVSIHG